MPADQQRVQSIFLAAIEAADPAARAALLARECGDDPELRVRVETLLEAHEQPGSFLAEPAVALEAAADSGPPQTVNTARACVAHVEGAGLVIGPYKLLQEIGEGGMGTVWMAEQTRPVQRKVALKIIKAGMDSRHVLARFEAERQALALMDHPNIAKVLDAGATPEGRPYFVMELVKGQPMTQYCDEHRLTPKERLELFIPVCQAIQHAHQKGIIHRDIKPSNVLVGVYDGKPVPKVIDFGVAKAAGPKLTEKTLYTEFGQVVGTLEYMSPEQAQLDNVDIDTRSDIYALGVLLYELLTGSTPLQKQRLKQAALLEVLRLIREEEPARPSLRLSTTAELPSVAANRGLEPRKLSGLIRGELDWIVMRSLEKDRNRRYETANGLARDIERYLNDEAVQACPPSASYRIRKLARRHKGLLLAASLVTVSLVAGIVGTTCGLIRAQSAWKSEKTLRKIADSSREDALRQKSAAVAAEHEAREETDRNRKLLYSADIQLASEVWEREDGTAIQCNELLRSQVPHEGQPDLREFCWRYQWGILKRGVELRFSTAPLAVAITADNQIVSIDEKGNLHSSEIGGRGKLRQFRLDGDHLLGATVSQTGNIAAVIDDVGSPKLFDAHAGSLLGPIRAPSPLTALQLTADGQFLAGQGLDRHVRVWEVATGKELYQYPLPDLVTRRLSISADGKVVLIIAHGAIVICRAGETKPVLLSFPNEFTRTSGAVSPDGTLAAVGNSGNFVDLYDTASQKGIATLRTRNAPRSCVFSPDGKLLSVGEVTGLITIWDISRQQIVRVLKGQEVAIVALAFASDGRRLLSVDRNGEARCWDLVDQEESTRLASPEGVACLSYSPDGRWLVVAAHDKGGRIGLYDLRSKGEPKILSKVPSRSAVVSPDGEIVAGAEFGKLSLWHAETGRLVCSFVDFSEEIGSMAFSPDGRWLAVGLGSPTLFFNDLPRRVTLFDVRSRAVKWTYPTQTQVSAVSFSLDGSLLAAAGHNGTIWLWDVASWKLVRQCQGPPGTRYASIVFLQDRNELAAGCASGTIDVWNLTSGTLDLVRSLRGHGSCVSALAISRDGRTLASGSWDRSIKLWDGRTFREMRTLRGHIHWLQALAFAPDGNTLASGGIGDDVRLWKATPIDAVVMDQPSELQRTYNAISEQPNSLESMVGLSGSYARAGRFQEALQLLEEMLRLAPQSHAGYNSLAWLLATCPEPKFRDPERAVALAQKAVSLAPQTGTFWNTLGVAHYRTGDWKSAIGALEKSMELGNGGDSFDWFFLGMANWQLANKDEARKRYEQAVEWMEKNQPKNEELLRIRAEAEALQKVKSGL